MVKYRIFETETFQEDLQEIARSGRHGIQKKLREHVYVQLRVEPPFGPNIKRLRNWEPPTWRYGVAAWRFFYEINEKEKIVSLTVAEHRGRSYR